MCASPPYFLEGLARCHPIIGRESMMTTHRPPREGGLVSNPRIHSISTRTRPAGTCFGAALRGCPRTTPIRSRLPCPLQILNPFSLWSAFELSQR